MHRNEKRKRNKFIHVNIIFVFVPCGPSRNDKNEMFLHCKLFVSDCINKSDNVFLAIVVVYANSCFSDLFR